MSKISLAAVNKVLNPINVQVSKYNLGYSIKSTLFRSDTSRTVAFDNVPSETALIAMGADINKEARAKAEARAEADMKRREESERAKREQRLAAAALGEANRAELIAGLKTFERVVSNFNDEDQSRLYSLARFCSSALERQIEVLETFNVDARVNPEHALTWADKVFNAVADGAVAWELGGFIVCSVEHGLKTTEMPVLIAELSKFLMERISRDVPASTSVCSNQIAAYKAAKYGSLLISFTRGH